MNTNAMLLFRGEVPSPKQPPKRGPGRALPKMPLYKLGQWAPWVLLGVVVYGLLFWGLGYWQLPSLSLHLLALVGVVVIAACLELASWVKDGKQPLALMPRMGAGGLIAMLIALL